MIKRNLAGRQRVLVAVDGPDTAGKTTLADRVARLVAPVAVRATLDGFHRPAADRAALPYEDSFDHRAMAAGLLEPFRAGAAEVCQRIFDHRADRPDRHHVDVPDRAVLVVDGVFLLRPELAPFWDIAVYLHVPDHVTVRRALVRDLHLYGTPATLEGRYATRYLPAQARYRRSIDPVARAHLVIDNSHPDHPTVIRDTLGLTG